MLLEDQPQPTTTLRRPAPAVARGTAERARLAEDARGEARWKLWGPYLSERQWGTVREDYSPYGNAWEYFPHDQARSRAYRWGEDGIAGISDDTQRLCLALRFVERQGPDPQGAPVRPDQRRRQPQRGRQGALLLSRRHADPLLPQVSLQVSAAGIPVQLAGRGEPPARPGPARVRADRHRRVRRRPLLRRLRRVRQGRARGHPDAGHGAQPRPRRGDAPRPAAALVPQHLVLARQCQRAPTSTPTTAATIGVRSKLFGGYAPLCRRRARRSCSATTTPTPGGCSASRAPRATSRTRSTSI